MERRTLTTAIRRDPESAFTRMGLILLATDLTTERDFVRMCAGPGLRMHVTRIPYANPVTRENLRAMGPHLGGAAALLAPGTDLCGIYYGCTSGSVVIGDDAVAASIRAERDVPVVTPVSAALDGLAALGAGAVSILTPYTEPPSLPVADHFAAHGHEVLSLACLGLDDDRDMARVTPDTLFEAALQAMHPDAEALFISCTALRSARVADRIEQALGKPVVTSNQAAAWRMLHLADRPTPTGCGRLMELSPA